MKGWSLTGHRHGPLPTLLAVVSAVMVVLGGTSTEGASRTGSQLPTQDVRIRLLSQTSTVGSSNRFLMRALIEGSQSLPERADVEVATDRKSVV